jgi:hypothetical protein
MIVLPQPSCHNWLKSLNSFSVGLLGADVAVLSLLAAFVVTSLSAVGAAFGLPAVFRIGLLPAAGAVFLTVLT